MKRYRITFFSTDTGKEKSFDLSTSNKDDAFRQGYAISQRLPYGEYSEMSLEEIPDGPSNIGLEIQYTDTVFKREFTGYLIIRARTEKEAVDYYNKNFKGGRFNFDIEKTVPDGKCIRGNVKKTYFAACPGYHADATKEI